MRRLALLLGVFAAGCTDAHEPLLVTEDGGRADAGGSADAGPGDAGTCEAPEGPYGASEGRLFAPLTLNRCDGTPLDFYGRGALCDGSLLVLVIAAGWNPPSRSESGRVETEIAVPFAARGVRVVQALLQDDDYRAPSAAYCNDWSSLFHLETTTVVIDPVQVTARYAPGGDLPVHLIIDTTGTIRHRAVGETLPTLAYQLDEILAGRGP